MLAWNWANHSYTDVNSEEWMLKEKADWKWMRENNIWCSFGKNNRLENLKWEMYFAAKEETEKIIRIAYQSHFFILFVFLFSIFLFFSIKLY